MARLSLNKSSLNRESKQLKTFVRFLPSLDLKRRQLIAERAKAVAAIAKTREELRSSEADIARDLPMLSNVKVDLTDLAKVTHVDIGEENIVGTRLPVLSSLTVKIRDYAFMGRPHWVDTVAQRLATVLGLRVRVQVEARRLELLEHAVRVITQRVNLFDKVLVPRARKNIKRIQIYLSDTERAGVVNAKLSKSKRARETVA